MLKKFFEAKIAEIRAREAYELRCRNYNDIGYILWYEVAIGNVLKYKADKVQMQQEPFFVYKWGQNVLMYGPIKGLTRADDKENFIKTAQAELRDCGYSSLKVKVYPDAVIVSRL